MTHEFLIDKKKIIVVGKIKVSDDFMNFKFIKFILDTGASKSIISDHVAIRLGYDLKKFRKGDRLMTVRGGVFSKIVNLPQISLFGIFYCPD